MLSSQLWNLKQGEVEDLARLTVTVRSLDRLPVLRQRFWHRKLQDDVVHPFRSGTDNSKAQIQLVVATNGPVHERFYLSAENLTAHGGAGVVSRFLNQVGNELTRLLQQPVLLLDV